MKSTRKAALFYAGLGWPIFPVWPMRNGRCACGNPNCERDRGKHPITYLGRRPIVPNGVKDATTDTDTINSWWDGIPDANIGARGEKWFALDVDDREALQVLREQHGELPDTVMSITGRGGYHIFFNQPATLLGNDEGDLPDGINVRGAGGYVILPPSNHHSGNNYEWEVSSHPRDTAVVNAPEWLLGLIDTNKATPQPVTFSSNAADMPALSRWDLSPTIIKLITAEPAGDRSRNDQKVITALEYAGASDDEIRAIFQHYPIGRGKYADKKGHADKYLGHSIGKAKAWVENHPPAVAQSLREVEPPLTAEQLAQVTAIIANLEKQWRTYHDEMTEAQRNLWEKLGIPEAVIDMLNLGYTAGQVDQDTGEILKPAGLTVPFTNLAGEVVNVEYRYGDTVSYEQNTIPTLFYPETTAASDCPILVTDDSLKAVTTWLAFGHRYQVAGLPHLKLRPESVDGLEERPVYVLLEPGAETKGRGLMNFNKNAKVLRLPMPIAKMLSCGLDERKLADYLGQARRFIQ